MTLENYLKHTNISHDLIHAVINQLGGEDEFFEKWRDITNHGAQAGVNGFIYHDENSQFVREHHKLIRAALFEFAAEIGEDAFDMIKNFNFLKGHGVTTEDVFTALADGTGENMLMSALAWFSLEHVVHDYSNYVESLND